MALTITHTPVFCTDLDEDREVTLGDNLAHRLAVGRRDVLIHGGQ